MKLKPYLFFLILLVLAVSTEGVLSNTTFYESFDTNPTNFEFDDVDNASIFTTGTDIYAGDNNWIVTAMKTGAAWTGEANFSILRYDPALGFGNQVKVFDDSAANRDFFVYHEFTNPINLDNRSSIDYLMNTTGGTINHYIIFSDGLTCPLVIGSSTTLGTSKVNNYCKSIGKYYDVFPVGTTHLSNFSYNLNSSEYIEGITRMTVMMTAASGGGQEIFYDEIYLYNITTGTNELPSFNFTAETKDCYNESLLINTYNITINLSANDPESDQIYYASDSFNVIQDRLQRFNSYTEYPILGRVDYQDYGVRDYEIIQTDSCPINYNLLEINTTNIEYAWVNTTYGENWMLGLNGDCGGNGDSFYYSLESIPKDFKFISVLYLLDIGEDFNISIWDSSITKRLLKFNVKRNATSVYYAPINTTGKQDYRNLGWNDGSLYFDFSTYSDSNISQIYFTKVDLSSSYNETFSLLDNSVYPKVLEIELDTGLIALDYFKYTALVQNFSFHTDPIQNMTVLGSKNKKVRIAVSDSVHQPSRYTVQTYNLFVKDCQYSGMQGVLDGDEASTTDFNWIPFLDGFLGKNMREYYSKTGYRDLSKSFLYWLWFFLFLIFLIGEYLVLRRLDLTFALVSSSLLCLFIALMLHYTTHIISFSVILAFGLAGPLALNYLGGQNGR